MSTLLEDSKRFARFNEWQDGKRSYGRVCCIAKTEYRVERGKVLKIRSFYWFNLKEASS